MLTLYIGADNNVSLEGLQNEKTAAYVNDATATFTVKDSSESPVTGAENVSMPYQAGSDGNYLGVLESSVSLTSGATYYLEITAASGSLNDFRRITCKARYRGES